MKSALNWFEIPVQNLERAAVCYETLLGSKLRRELFRAMPYAIFPHQEPGVGGALVQDPQRPTGGGTLVYLDAGDALDAILARTDAARATIVLPKTAIGADGFIAIIRDTEGNHVGLNGPT